MATSAYPGAIDTFNVPTLPEGTPLSSAGGATRNHTQLHDAIDAAVVALQTYASQRQHDHSGDPNDPTKGPKLLQANTHQSPDTDASLTSLHHTLGTLPTQAAAGDHHHDWHGGTLDNKDMEVCLSTQRPQNPFLGKQIYEYDTNRHRVWSAFAGNAVNKAVNGTESFELTSPTNPGPDWAVTYVGATTMGYMAVPDGHTLSWVDRQGLATQTNRCIARNINSTFGHTNTTDQVVIFQTGNMIMEQTPFGIGDTCYNDVYLRMTDDGQQYIRIAISWAGIDVFYSTGPSTQYTNELQLGNRIWGTCGGAQITWQIFVVGRTITIYRDGAYFGSVTDSANVTFNTANNKGWGTGMVAPGALITQVTPANLNYISIADATQYGTIQRWTLLNDASVPHCLLRQTVPQQLPYFQGGVVVNWTTATEDNFGYWNQGTPGQIVVTEPGIYHFDVGFQWDAGYVADQGTVIVCVNGLNTELQNSAALRGNGINPGFSQSLVVSGKLRLNATDIVTVKVAYKPGSGFLNYLLSYFDGASKIMSRIDMSFIGL